LSFRNQVSEFLLPFNHLYQACSGPGLREVPVDTFQLSGSRKICISFGIDPFKSIFHLEKIAIDRIDLLRFIAIFCDFFLGNQIRHRGKTEEDCKALLPSMVSLLGTVESSKDTEWKVIE